MGGGGVGDKGGGSSKKGLCLIFLNVFRAVLRIP